MSIEDAFIQAIRSDPRAAAPRLIYADWLEEHGGTSSLCRAEYLRAECELDALPRRDHRRQRLQTRLRELRTTVGNDWRRQLDRMMTPQQRQSRGELLGAAWKVAADYRTYNAYGSESRACKALQRRCPRFTARQYQNAFQKAVALYDAAVELVARHADALWRQTDVEANRFPDFRDLVSEVRPRYPGFLVSTYRAALGWVFFWHHLK